LLDRRKRVTRMTGRPDDHGEAAHDAGTDVSERSLRQTEIDRDRRAFQRALGTGGDKDPRTCAELLDAPSAPRALCGCARPGEHGIARLLDRLDERPAHASTDAEHGNGQRIVHAPKSLLI